MQARDYQTWAVQALWQYFREKTGNPLVAMPTGTGKSVVIALWLQSIFSLYPTSRVLVITHVKELIAQNFDKLKILWPQAPAGIYSAGLNQRDVLSRIVFCGIASIAKRADMFGHVDMIMIDEAHLLSPNDKTMYQAFIRLLRNVNPYLKVIGLTATPFRLQLGLMTNAATDKDEPLFTDIPVDMTGLKPFNWLLEQGYLCPLIPRATKTLLNVDGVHMQGGEYKANELQAAVDKAHITEAACRETLELAGERHHWLTFCSGIDHAEHTAEILQSLGVHAVPVHSKMKGDRDKIIAAWKAGDIRCVTNNGVLTTGIDFPGLDLIMMLRPTASTGLWVQMLGRGTRPLYADGFDLNTVEGRLHSIAASPKQNCLVLDYAGNTKKLGPINDPVLPRRKGEGKGEAPVKLCDHCGVWCHASLRICNVCGTPFPDLQVKIKAQASSQELIKLDIPVVECYKVDHITYGIHTKPGSPMMMKVSYYCGLRMFNEFVCFEHDKFAGRKARMWWAERTGEPFPSTTLEGMQKANALLTATHLQVWVNKQYPQIQAYCFDGTAFGTQQVTQAPPPALVSMLGPPMQPRAQAPKPTTPASSWDDDIPF